MPGLKIAIVGAGLGGLALAGFLDQCDIEYSILEKRTAWDCEGFCLGLWNNGRHILRKLGLADRLDETHVPFQTLLICNSQGRTLRSYNLAQFYTEFGMAYSHVRRAELHRWLLTRVARPIRMGVSIESVVEKDDGVSLRLSDGTHEYADLVVGADGVHSLVRDLCFRKHVEWYLDWRAWYVWVDRSFARPRVVSQFLAPHELISVFDEGDKALVVLVAKADHSMWDDPDERVDRLKALFKDEQALVPQILEKVVSQEILPADLVEVALRRWHTARVVLIGDAAHGFEPFAGLGGSMALEDAYVLSAELARMASSGAGELSSALERYEHLRKSRVRQARQLTRRMQCWATVESPFWRSLINQFVPIVPESWITRGYFDFMRHEM